MYREENENECDAILGEAVIALLNELSPITNAALLHKLQSFLVTEEEAWREAAIRTAIGTVSAVVMLH